MAFNSNANTNITDLGNKKKALDLALATIEKQFGKGAIMRLGVDQSSGKNSCYFNWCFGTGFSTGCWRYSTRPYH